MERFEKHCSACLAPCPYLLQLPQLPSFFIFISACKTLSYIKAFAHATLCLEFRPGLPTTESFSFLFLVLAAPGYTWTLVLSSPTSDWACAPCAGGQMLNSRATGEIPPFSFLLMSPPPREHPVGSRCPKHHHPISFNLYFHCFIHSTYPSPSSFTYSVSFYQNVRSRRVGTFSVSCPQHWHSVQRKDSRNICEVNQWTWEPLSHNLVCSQIVNQERKPAFTCPVFKCAVLSRSVVSDSETPWTTAHQAPPSMRIHQARILEWVAMPSSRGSSQPRDGTQVSRIAGRFFAIWATREALFLNRKLNN